MIYVFLAIIVPSILVKFRDSNLSSLFKEGERMMEITISLRVSTVSINIHNNIWEDFIMDLTSFVV